MINTVQHDIGGKQNGQTRIWILLLALGLLLAGCGTVTQERPSLTEELTEEADFDTANLGEAVARINAGGPAVTTSGVRWSADQHFSGGRTYSNSNVKSIANTRDTALYLRGRVPPANGNGRMSYSIPVPAKGQYIVRLHFAEIYWGSPGWGSRGGAGTRVFSVDLEKGSARLRNYDIFRDVGPRRAVIKSYEVTVNDGRLNLDFSASKDRPKIAAIEVYRKASGSTAKPPKTSPSAPKPSPSPEPKAPSTRPSNSGNGSMRGNPSFSESQLPSEVRTWYRRMWAFINNRNQIPNHRAMASSGDLNHYARNLNKYHTTLLAIFRSTGDLRILDEVARNAQSMYDTLRDTDRDGYRNWQFKGKNTSRPMLEEPMAHAHVAALAYALNANRGLSSPSGINYGRLADNLLHYLRNDFEPKWRKRNARTIAGQGSAYPFIRATNHHAYVNLMRYHDYMYKLTGERGYRDYLDTMSNVIRRDVRDISTPIGTALVWGGSVASDPFNYRKLGDELNLQPTIYANDSYAAMLDLHLEGVAPFDRSFMEKLSRTLSHFILDRACTRNCSGSSGQLRIDVGGERDRRANNGSVYKTGSAQKRGFKPQAYNHYGSQGFTPYAAFDTTRDQKLTQVNLAAFQAIENWGTEQPRRGFIPMGMVFALLNK